MLSLLLCGLYFGISLAQDGSIQPEQEETCRNCHENLYMLHDTGKSFCLCVEEMTCSCCHGGNPEAVIEEDAHQGMLLRPVHGDSQPCQKCHQDDADARVDKFAALAGVTSFHTITPTQIPLSSANIELPDPPKPLHWLENWQWFSLGVVMLGMVAIVIFGYHCWRADCLPKIQKIQP